jgi:hypothetical protein
LTLTFGNLAHWTALADLLYQMLLNVEKRNPVNAGSLGPGISTQPPRGCALIEGQIEESFYFGDVPFMADCHQHFYSTVKIAVHQI